MKIKILEMAQARIKACLDIFGTLPMYYWNTISTVKHMLKKQKTLYEVVLAVPKNLGDPIIYGPTIS